MSAPTCPQCGYPVTAAMSTCPNCGTSLRPAISAAGAASSVSSSPTTAIPATPASGNASTSIAGAIQQNSVPPLPSLSPQPAEKKPYRMPSRSPDLEGTILSISYHIEFPPEHTFNPIVDLFDFILDLFFPTSPDQRYPRMPRGVRATIVRLRKDDGTLRDARFEGDLTGAGLTLGDRLSLWGRSRKGTLLVSKGLNQTVQAAILTNAYKVSMLLTLLLPILLYVLIAIIYFLFVFRPH